MKETSKHFSRRIIQNLVSICLICVLFLGSSISVSAGVSATDISSYARSGGDTYETLSTESKKGYEIAKNTALIGTDDVFFCSKEENNGYWLYMYDHPAIANNTDPLTRHEAAATLTKALEIVRRCSGTTMYDQALSLHDMLCDTVEEYGCKDSRWDGQSAYEALVLRMAVCNGYASAYKLLCDLKGIPCHIVYGIATDELGPGSHAWNVIRLDDGQWYEVDVTWNDTIGCRDYFCRTTEEMADLTRPSGKRTSHVRQIKERDPRSAQAPVARGTKYGYKAMTNNKKTASSEDDTQGKELVTAVSTTDYAAGKEMNTVETTVTSSSVTTSSNSTKVTTYNKVSNADKAKTVKVKKVKFAKKYNSLKKGKTLTLKANIEPKNATNREVTWKSSNKKVATIDKNGKVKALKKGSVTITVTTKDGKKKARCKLTVK